jgi:uncharacterized integral membrane protein
VNPKNTGGFMQVKLIILMILIVLFTIFVSKNTAMVDLWFFFWPINVSKIVILTIIFAVGAITGLLVSALFIRSKEKKLRKEEPKKNIPSGTPYADKKNIT